VIASVCAVVVAAGVGVAIQQLTRTDRRTTARTVDEAVDQFRTTEPLGDGSPHETAGSTSTAPPARGSVLPEPGVYVYTTTGSDGVDALGGAEHAYPSTTTITVRLTGCGVTKRWDVAVERWERISACVTADGIQRSAFTSYHEFFGVGDTDREQCRGDPRPLDADPGTTWSFVCAEGDDEGSSWVGTVLGPGTVDVGGDPIEADHVLLETTDESGDDDMRIESWFVAGTDLVARETGERHTTDPSPLGAVHYQERYEIVLTSLEPLR
jgi:hypothetical protein